jgi:hypothetical protein
MPRNNTGLEDMAHSHSVYRIYENISLARKESRFRDGNGGVTAGTEQWNEAQRSMIPMS